MLLAKMEMIMRQKHTLDNHIDVEVKSLNFTVRKKEMIKITSENMVCKTGCVLFLLTTGRPF